MDKPQNSSATDLVLENIRNGVSPEQIQVDDQSMSNYLNHLVGRRNVPLCILADLVGINRTTLYRVLSGNMKPSRNLMIRLGLELLVSYEEMQMLLKLSCCAALSGTRKRDVFIINAVVNHQPVGELESILTQNNLESILTR